tara:strand:+ start:9431 stop:10411 length:981 start_codon:yes stop_codon:yes gene_type:complete
MTENENEASDASWFDELLAEMGQRAEATLAEFMAQDPAAIDIADRLPYLPRMVLDGLAAIKDQLNDESRAAIEEWQEQERQRHREMWEAAERSHIAFLKALPPNWRTPDIEFPSIEELEELQLNQGLPLAWLPPNQVLGALLELDTSEERSRLIEDEATVILEACEVELERLKAELTREWRVSAMEAVGSMRAGHWRAGQALAAIAMDTAVEEFVIKSGYKSAVAQTKDNKPTPPGALPTSFPTWRDIDYPRVLLVMYGIWGSYKQFWVKRGDAVPAQFSRHGTIHSMSPRQYTKANALIAAMHVVGLLCVLDEMIEDSSRNRKQA